MCDPYTEKVVVVLASQMGKTVMLRIAEGFAMSEDPGPIMMIQPSETMAKSYSRDRFTPFVRDSPVLSGLIAGPKSRDTGNTVLYKQFPGGHITFSGANSAASLASRPIRYLQLDEVNRYPLNVGGEGDPVSVAERRATRFWNRKIIISSTPTISNLCKISYEFGFSNQQYFNVPCPECGFFQVLVFKNMKYKKPYSLHNVAYECINDKCGHHITEKEKAPMIRAGKYVETQKSKIKGFHCWEAYVIGTEWGEICEAWVKAQGIPEVLQVVVNTRFAEVFDDHGEAPDYENLYGRRGKYASGQIQPEVLFLTATVDVQGDRLEAELRGWGRNHQSWSIEKYVFAGDTSQQDVYANLDSLLEKRFIHPNGAAMAIKGMGIDSGHNAQAVYFWARKQELGRVFVVKGETLSVPIAPPKVVDINYQGKKILGGLKLWGIGVSILKSELYKRLRLKRKDDGTYPDGFIHFPDDYPEEHFRQITAESLRVTKVKGKKKYMWEENYVRNEALDLAVYNRAIAIILGIDYLTDEQWEKLEKQTGIVATATPPARRGRRVLNKGIRK